MSEAPELESVEDFVEFLLAEERETFTLSEVQQIAFNTKTSDPKVIADLKAYGLEMLARVPEKRVRGFNSNSHDRWHGPGSCKTHGGSGWEQITGIAGQEG